MISYSIAIRTLGKAGKKYQKLLTAIKGIRNSMNAHPDCEPNSEFEDMVSRCDEILEAL